MIGASRPALATTNKNNRVYRLTTLPTETIFSIRLVGLTKHHVFVVYQRRSHPCRPEGRLNHLIYWVVEDTQNASSVKTQRVGFRVHAAVFFGRVSPTPEPSPFVFAVTLVWFTAPKITKRCIRSHRWNSVFVCAEFRLNWQMCWEGPGCLWTVDGYCINFTTEAPPCGVTAQGNNCTGNVGLRGSRSR